MRLLGLAAAIALAVAISGCGGNSTTIGVTISPAGSSSASYPVIKGGTQVFTASVAGGTSTTVYWQICLAVPITSPPTQPTDCTPIPGVTSQSTWTLTGYGTITQDGLYTAPTTIPQNNPFVIMASSQVDYQAFGLSYVSIDSGIRVQMNPTSATIAAEETYSLTATVTGTTNTGLTWSVNNVAGGDSTNGTITPTGPQTALYQAPTSPITATVTATSTADPSKSANASIGVVAGVDPVLDSVDPTTAAQGSVQQDIYVTGQDFLSTSVVLVNGTPLPTTFLSSDLLRATIPSTLLTQAGSIPMHVQRQNGDLNVVGPKGPVNLTVLTPRPSVVASAPDSVPATNAGFGVSLTGGFFISGTTSATFNSFSGPSPGVGSTFASSRQMTVNIPAGSLSIPGLYPIVVQNNGVSTGPSSTSATNIAVTPAAGTLLSSPTATIGVGASPSAIAIDEADGLALVVNTGDNTVSVISLASNSVVRTVAVGNSPTGVAIDDALLPPLDHIALVVNSADNTLSAIDLSSFSVSTLTLPALPAGSAPFSVGINPATHHAVVANSVSNLATILDLSSGAPVYLQQIGGGNLGNYGTGPMPEIAVDPRLNWAIVSGGGGGTGVVDLVDLGRNAVAGIDAGRSPSVVGTVSLTASGSGIQGVGINAQTHEVLLTGPSAGGFPMISLLDQSISAVPFTQNGVIVSQPGYVADAVSGLANLGVAVNANANTAAVLDLQNRIVVENVTTGNQPVAVAVDPSTNEALVVNQGDGTVSVLSLGTVRSSASLGAAQAPQITRSSPEIAFTSANSATLTVTGGGFANNAQVFLDGTALASVSVSGRQIVATVPAAMLSAARRYSVYVQNPGQAAISNIEDLIVVQPITVGASPYGVAVDAECDLAAVTNSGDGTVSLVALASSAPPGEGLCPSIGAVGTVGPPISVGTTPEGIAIEPRLGAAMVANSGSLNGSVIDLTEMNPPASVQLCGGTCESVTAVAMNHDTATAYVADSLQTTAGLAGNVSQVGITLNTAGVPSGTPGGIFSNLDLTPTSVAYDPYLEYVGVATAGLTSDIDIINLASPSTFSRAGGLTGAGLQVPMGIIFDPVNQVFLAANSLVNNIIFVDPSTAIASSAQVGMNPTALDYDYQTSTLVTANSASDTVSIVDYVCPPSIVVNCSAPQVRQILALGSSPQFSVGIDAKLNIVVLADQQNNRVLLVPLP